MSASCRRTHTHKQTPCFSIEAGCSPDRRIFLHVTDMFWQSETQFLYLQAVFISWCGKRMRKLIFKMALENLDEERTHRRFENRKRGNRGRGTNGNWIFKELLRWSAGKVIDYTASSGKWPLNTSKFHHKSFTQVSRVLYGNLVMQFQDKGQLCVPIDVLWHHCLAASAVLVAHAPHSVSH